jgi:serine/threonine protein phosphatase 1
MKRYYAIGDIHGMLSKLEALLDMIPMDTERDTLVLLGDYLDQGPEPAAVVQRIIDLRACGCNVVALKGNHEAVFLDLLEGKYDYWLYRDGFGGAPTLRDYSYHMNFLYRKGVGARPDLNGFFHHEDADGHRLAVPLPHLDFLRSLPLYHETDDFIFVHAGLAPSVPLAEQREEDLLWIREEFLHSNASFGKVVVHGHTPVDKPEITGTRIGIDTGAGYGGKLTCVRLPDLELYSV